ncbi:MAG TPA: hypothetical protein VN408_01820 [Actinoplanes sp.]|nr:hypothetical protein [Actinoplanes sp.]
MLTDQTVRQVVHLSLGGDQIRLRLTNEFGTAPLRIGAVRVALREGTGASTDARPGSGRRVTFGGRESVVVPHGSALAGDPIALPVPGGADLVISLHLPERTPVTTVAGVIDFDRAVLDPADPERLAAAFGSGDHLHPNDAGMAAMAAAVPVGLFS